MMSGSDGLAGKLFSSLKIRGKYFVSQIFRKMILPKCSSWALLSSLYHCGQTTITFIAPPWVYFIIHNFKYQNSATPVDTFSEWSEGHWCNLTEESVWKEHSGKTRVTVVEVGA